MATTKYTRIKVYTVREDGSIEFSMFYLKGEVSDVTFAVFEEEED